MVLGFGVGAMKPHCWAAWQRIGVLTGFSENDPEGQRRIRGIPV
jgi:hypothetical protein